MNEACSVGVESNRDPNIRRARARKVGFWGTEIIITKRLILS
jgi:hypothetical protein